MQMEMIRAYKLENYDIMTIESKHYDNLSEWVKSMFIIVKIEYYRKWYNPFSWFKKYYKLKFRKG